VKFILILGQIIFGLSTLAAEPAGSKTWTTIKSGASISITKYDKKTDLFEVSVSKEEAVGPLWVTNKALAKSLGRTEHLGENIVSNEYKIDEALPVLTSKAVQALKKAPAKK
jgi:hypothetical protein